MMIFCMNDKGSNCAAPDPLCTTRRIASSATNCPFMPGQTQYLDTPVVPTSAFLAPGTTILTAPIPMPLRRSPRSTAIGCRTLGQRRRALTHTLTITALADQHGDQLRLLRPAATAAPFNAEDHYRHYGFGATTGTVALGGVTAGYPR